MSDSSPTRREPRSPAPLWLAASACSVIGVLYLVLGADPDPGTRPRTAQPATPAAGSSGLAPTRPSLPAREQAGTGPHTLPGTVLDAAGTPVAGAAVTAELELGPGLEVAGPGLDTTPEVVAVAAADGSFSLVGLAPGRYRLRVEAEGVFPAEVRFFEVPSDGVRLVVARKVAVRGTVRAAQGAPAASMPVRLVSEAGGQVETTTDAQGAFAFDELSEGMFQVWAGAGELAAPAQRVSRLGPGPFEPVTLTLAPATIVSGRVIDRATRQGVAAAVVLSATSSEEPPRYGQSDSDGNFRIEAVPGGRWSADAFAPGYVATEAIEFEAGGPAAPVLELTRGGIIAGRVVDRRGMPIANAVISVQGRDAADRSLSMSEQSQLQRARRFRGLAGLAPADSTGLFIPRGELGVLLGPLPFPPPPGASALRFAARLSEPGSDAGTATVPELPVPEDIAPIYVTDAQGRFRLTGLPAGRLQVAATHPEYADGQSRPVVLAMGQRVDNVTIVLVPGVLLVGTVRDTHEQPVVGATITAQALASAAPGKKAGNPALGQGMGQTVDLAAPGRLHAITDFDGRYRLGPIAMDVRLHVTAVGHGDAERAVRLGELADNLVERTEDFVLVSADATLSGRVRDPAGFPVRGAVVAIESEGSAGGRQTMTDDHGRFTIAWLAPGSYALALHHAQFPRHRITASTDAPVELTMPLGGGVDGQVRDEHTSNPVEGAQIKATAPEQPALTTATAADGGFTLAPLAAGTWSVQVSAPGYVPTTHSVAVRAGQEPGQVTEHEVRITLARGATVAGVVRDADGLRVAGARVRAGTVETRTDAEGSFQLRDVPVGDTEITAERDEARGSVTVGLRPGDEVLTLEIAIE